MVMKKDVEYRIRLAIYSAIFCIAAIYFSQIAIFRARFSMLDTNLVPFQIVSEHCDDKTCEASWEIIPKERFLLLGHILRTHQLFLNSDHSQVFPVSNVRSGAADSWNSLRVYLVKPGETYRIEASKPRAVRMGYFVGIWPRSSDNEGLLSVPDIGPTVSMLSSMGGFGLLGVLLFAAFLAPVSGADKKREYLQVIALSSVAALLAVVIGTGGIDSLIPDGELRSRILRTAIMTSIALLPLNGLVRKFVRRHLYANLLCLFLVILFVNLNWAEFRAGIAWSLSLAVINACMIGYLYKRLKSPLIAAFAIIGFYDPVSMMGWRFVDFPPIYVLNAVLIMVMSLAVADLGAISMLALAARAYQHFTRELALSEIAALLEYTNAESDFTLAEKLKSSLTKISKLTGAGQVCVVVSLPSMRPIAHSYSKVEGKIITYDDGQIRGAVTQRLLREGDELWFESYSEFAAKLGLPFDGKYFGSKYACFAPIKVHQSIIGALMLTKFDDDQIATLKRESKLENLLTTGRMLVNTLANALTPVVIHQMESRIDTITTQRSEYQDSFLKEESLRKEMERLHSIESEKFAKDQAVAQMTQMLAHDIRKPFSLLRLGLGMLGQAKDPAAVKLAMSRIVPEIDKAILSVDGMLADVMEVGSVTTNLIQEPASPERLIDSTLREVVRMYPKAQIEFTYEFTHEHMINVHVQKVGRMLSNIVGNSFQAMRTKGSMWFRTVERDGMIEFCLGNAGSLIPTDVLPNIFETFFTSGKKGGTGLGLAIAKKIVNAHGGKIWCESSTTNEHPAGKVEFYFTLPVANRINSVPLTLPAHSSGFTSLMAMMANDAIPEPKSENDELSLEEEIIRAHAGFGRALTVMIADDEEIYRSGLASYLTRTSGLRESIHITECNDADAAIGAAKACDFDLIITDIDMGSMSLDGFEVVRRLRDGGSTSIICVHSNRIAAEDGKSAIAAGADNFLPKRIGRAQLLRIVLQSEAARRSRR
jgi:signal transduction histidine kinase/ActR/RegA family two-component response regulator